MCLGYSINSCISSTLLSMWNLHNIWVIPSLYSCGTLIFLAYWTDTSSGFQYQTQLQRRQSTWRLNISWRPQTSLLYTCQVPKEGSVKRSRYMTGGSFFPMACVMCKSPLCKQEVQDSNRIIPAYYLYQKMIKDSMPMLWQSKLLIQIKSKGIVVDMVLFDHLWVELIFFLA